MGAKKSLEAANADLEMQYDVLSKNFADAGKNYKKLQASFKDLQDENDAAGVAYSELKDQFAANERKYGLLFADYEEIKGTLDANDRTRKAAADELANLIDAYQTLTAQNAALSSAKRKLESEHEVMHNDREDATAAAKSAEDAAKKALADAAKLSEDWKAQGNTIAALEKLKKTLEGQNHALAMKLDDAEAAALKGSKKAVAALKAQYDALNADYEAQGKDYANLNKNFRKQDRKMKELAFQADEDAKNNTRMQELVSKLQGKLKQYKLQSEEAEALAKDKQHQRSSSHPIQVIHHKLMHLEANMTDVRWSTVEHSENLLDPYAKSNDRTITVPAMLIFIIMRMFYFDHSQLPHPLSNREQGIEQVVLYLPSSDNLFQ